MKCLCGLPMREKAIYKDQIYFECFHCDCGPCVYGGDITKCTNCATVRKVMKGYKV